MTKELIDQTVAAQGAAVGEVAAFVEQSLQETLAKLARTPPTQWTKQALGQIVNDITRAAREMGLGLDQQISAAQRELVAVGSDQVFEPLVSLDLIDAAVVNAFPAFDATLLNILGSYRAELITVLASDARDAIAQRVALGISNGRDAVSTIESIAELIGKDPRGGPSVFGSILARAEAIYDTESMRAYSLARRSRGYFLEATYPTTLHGWHSLQDNRVRDSHQAANRLAPIPFKQRFPIGPVPIRMLYPHDVTAKGPARALAAESVRCRCSEWYDLPEGAARNAEARGRTATEQAERSIREASDGVDALRADLQDRAPTEPVTI